MLHGSRPAGCTEGRPRGCALLCTLCPVRLETACPVLEGAVGVVQLDGGLQLTELYGEVSPGVGIHEVVPLGGPLLTEVDAKDAAGVLRARRCRYQLLMAVDVAEGVVHRLGRQILRRDGKEWADRHGALCVRELGSSDHQVCCEDVDV